MAGALALACFLLKASRESSVLLILPRLSAFPGPDLYLFWPLRTVRPQGLIASAYRLRYRHRKCKT